MHRRLQDQGIQALCMPVLILYDERYCMAAQESVPEGQEARW
jgi:hypothetical protein